MLSDKRGCSLKKTLRPNITIGGLVGGRAA